MIVVYIAGPFRAPSALVPGTQNAWRIQSHVMAAMDAALTVWRAGMVALCPHANTMFFQGAAPDAIWLDGDLELLRRCDAVLLVDGWKRSSGALAERDAAKALGIPVFEDVEPLYAWRDVKLANRITHRA